MKRLCASLLFALALAVAPAAGALAEEPGLHGETVEGQGIPAPEHGAEHGEHGGPAFDWKTFGLQMLNFGVLVFILVKFGGRAMSRAMAERHQQLKTDIEAANRAREAAEAKLREQEGRLESMKQEVEALRANMAKTAEADRARILAAAEERAAILKKETAFMLDQQVRAAEQQLRREVAEQALVLAEQTLRQKLQAADQQRMVTSFMQDASAGTAVPAGKEVS